MSLEPRGGLAKPLPERFGKKIGFEAKFTLQRTKFGVSYMTPGIGDDVDVTLSIEANLAKD